jgi:DNA-binding CsgD family transcriptional regulator
MSLTPREKELRDRLYTAATLRKAAYDMGIKLNTAKTMTDRIYKKLGIHSRNELMANRIKELENGTQHRP